MFDAARPSAASNAFLMALLARDAATLASAGAKAASADQQQRRDAISRRWAALGAASVKFVNGDGGRVAVVVAAPAAGALVGLAGALPPPVKNELSKEALQPVAAAVADALRAADAAAAASAAARAKAKAPAAAAAPPPAVFIAAANAEADGGRLAAAVAGAKRVGGLWTFGPSSAATAERERLISSAGGGSAPFFQAASVDAPDAALRAAAARAAAEAAARGDKCAPQALEGLAAGLVPRAWGT